MVVTGYIYFFQTPRLLRSEVCTTLHFSNTAAEKLAPIKPQGLKSPIPGRRDFTTAIYTALVP